MSRSFLLDMMPATEPMRPFRARGAIRVVHHATLLDPEDAASMGLWVDAVKQAVNDGFGAGGRIGAGIINPGWHVTVCLIPDI
jgi:hypothetical protein